MFAQVPRDFIVKLGLLEMVITPLKEKDLRMLEVIIDIENLLMNCYHKNLI